MINNQFLFRFAADGKLWLRVYVLASLVRALYYNHAAWHNYVATALGATHERLEGTGIDDVPIEVWKLPAGEMIVGFRGVAHERLLHLIQHCEQVAHPPFPGRVLRLFASLVEEHFNRFKHLINPSVDFPVILAGHSMGGALAHLCGHLFQRDFNPSRLAAVWSFGSPMTGDATYAAVDTFKHIRVGTELDLVPELPPTIAWLVAREGGRGTPSRYIYRHNGVPIWFLNDGKVIYGTNREEAAPVDLLPFFETSVFNPFNFAAHNMAEYARRARFRFALTNLDPWVSLDRLNNEINEDESLLWRIPPVAA